LREKWVAVLEKGVAVEQMREAIHTIAVTVEWMVVAVQLVREDVVEKPMGVDRREAWWSREKWVAVLEKWVAATAINLYKCNSAGRI
jgi:hypothetical protein